MNTHIQDDPDGSLQDAYQEEMAQKPVDQLKDEGRIWFGSHKGLLWSELSDGSLSWLERNMSGFVKDIATSEIQRRRDI
jgi:ligand-binding sensor domain-containing protein